MSRCVITLIFQKGTKAKKPRNAGTDEHEAEEVEEVQSVAKKPRNDNDKVSIEHTSAM